MHEVFNGNDELEPMEVPAENLLEGDPRPRVKVTLHVPGDMAGGMSGVFEADPGAMRNPQEGIETYYVLAGSASVVDPGTGEAFKLNAGDVLVLSPGAWEWTYETRFRSLFAMGPTIEPHSAWEKSS
jgi:uncharacterized cupin superfamily protein